jgi:hypothetical protein
MCVLIKTQRGKWEHIVFKSSIYLSFDQVHRGHKEILRDKSKRKFIPTVNYQSLSSKKSFIGGWFVLFTGLEFFKLCLEHVKLKKSKWNTVNATS